MHILYPRWEGVFGLCAVLEGICRILALQPFPKACASCHKAENRSALSEEIKGYTVLLEKTEECLYS